MKKILAGILGSLLIHDALACTAVDVKAQDGSVVAGRTMEWAYEMQWNLLFYPQGSTYQLTAPAKSGHPAKTLTSRYAVLGIGTGMEDNAMLEGQNSAGVGVSGNFLPGFTHYQTVGAKDHQYLSVLEFIRFVLSNYGSVAEIKKSLPEYKVWAPKLSNLPVEPSIHFLISDKSGANIVVEFINGQMRIFDKTVGVMTNSPNYDWHMINIRNYVNLSNDGTSSRNSELGNVTAFGQGGGAIGLPGDFTPPSRFVKTTFLNYFSDQPKDAAGAINLVDHILNNVDIPIGVISAVESGTKTSDYTQWVAIKDLSNNQLAFSDYRHRTNFVMVDMKQLVNNGKQLVIPVTKLPYPNTDISGALLK